MRVSVLLLLLGAAVACGCVERRMVIRSRPAGAPVWVNEAYAGVTPLEHPFAHYGVSSIRVGPVRDAEDRLLFHEAQVLYEAEAPWFEKFPIDFFFEVLYPGTMTDVHEVPEVELVPAKELTEEEVAPRVESVLKSAEEFRRRALEPVPDAPLAE